MFIFIGYIGGHSNCITKADNRVELIDNIVYELNNKVFTSRSKDGIKGVFSRDRKLPLKNVLLLILSSCSSIQRDLDRFYKSMNKSDYPKIGVFCIPKTGSETPQENVSGNWQKWDINTVKSTSAVGYYFARELYKKLNVPVGIIVSVWGGTPVEVWMKQACFEKDSVLRNAASKLNESTWCPVKPIVNFNRMIHTIILSILLGFFGIKVKQM